jgi:hypothetical protein
MDRKLIGVTLMWVIAAAIVFPDTAFAQLAERRFFQTLHPYEEFSPLGENRPQFGAALAIRDDTALVGMPAEASGGAVAIYDREGRGWRRIGFLPCPDERACESVHSIAMRDNIAVVGTPGTVLVFRREREQWAFKARIGAPQPGLQGFPNPGSIRYQDGIVTAGATTATERGVVFAFELSPAATLARTSHFSARDATAGDRFGSHVSMSVDGIIVGAPGARRGASNDGVGAAYVFRLQSGAWVQTQKLVPADAALGFGEALAIDKGVLLIGAPEEARGAVYEFRKAAGIWRQQSKFRPSLAQYASYRDFGREIVMWGDRAVIAATETSPVTPAEALAFEYGMVSTGIQPISFARRRSPGAIALSNNMLGFGGPFESADPEIGHVALYDLGAGLPPPSFCATAPTGPGHFCDDFESGTAEKWQPVDGTWTVDNAEYVGRAGNDRCGTGFSSNETLVRNLQATDVDISLEMRSIQRVDKGIILRSTSPENQIELNFLADGFNLLIVQHLIDCQLTLLHAVGVPHQLGEIIRVRARLVGQRLQVWVNGRQVLDGLFPFRTARGAVGMSVITDLGYSVFDNVRVDVLR